MHLFLYLSLLVIVSASFLFPNQRGRWYRKFFRFDPFRFVERRSEYVSVNVEHSSPLIQSLNTVCAPFCLTGDAYFKYLTLRDKIYKNSTIHSLNLTELIMGATQSSFGQGTKNYTDTTVRDSFEIPASELNDIALKRISDGIKPHLVQFASHLQLELRLSKLVIYKEDGHFDEHRDTARDKTHIGRLIVILNSKYKGGELEITHNGYTKVVTGAYKWVAMYNDCLHKINPVTSGTRVALIYDIYGSIRDPNTVTYKHTGKVMMLVHKLYRSVFNGHSGDLFPHKTRNISNTHRAVIKASLDKELTSYNSLIITLQHLYPSQTSPAFLKGGDRALYDLLSEEYDVKVVRTPYSVIRSTNNRNVNDDGVVYTTTSISRYALGFDTHSSRRNKMNKRYKLKILNLLRTSKSTPIEDVPRKKHTKDATNTHGLLVTKRVV